MALDNLNFSNMTLEDNFKFEQEDESTKTNMTAYKYVLKYKSKQDI